METASGCAWGARSDGGFLSIVEGAGGLGGGEVVYRVPANAGWEREAALLVAAEVYLVRQEGARPVTPVCDRSPAVSGALAAALDKPCAQIADADLASVGTLRVDLPQAGTLKSGDFSGLSNLGWLLINPDSPWEEKPSLRLAPDLFEGLSRLRYLGLWGNSISALPPGLFKDLSELRTLDLSVNQLAELAPGAFDGLDSLESLELEHNDLSRLPPGLFDGLTNLWELALYENRLTTLSPSSFDGLSNLRELHLDSNSLTALPQGLFDGLGSLDVLNISNNQLTALSPDLFDGLSNLWQLIVSGNRLTTLPAALLDGSSLWSLLADDNQLIALPPNLFAGHPLDALWLSGNRLRSLPSGLIEGVTKLRILDLSDNPGAPFTLALELVALSAPDPSADGSSAAIAAEVASGAPFDMQAGISASGGTLSADAVSIEAGQIRGERISVAPQGDGPVTVELDAVSGFLKEWECDDIVQAHVARERCYWGIRMAAGAPLVLHGLPDRTLAPDGAMRFDLPSAFSDFPDGTAYTVELSNPAAAEATVREGLLILSAADGGGTEVAVTATGADGRRETKRFTVTVEQTLGSLWGGWRSTLLRPPPAEEGDGG